MNTTIKIFDKDIELGKRYSLNRDKVVSIWTDDQIETLQSNFDYYYEYGRYDAFDIVDYVGCEVEDRKVDYTDSYDEDHVLSGDFKQRLEQFWRIEHGGKIKEQVLRFIGDMMTQIRQSIVPDMSFEITNVIDWKPGDFADSTSCWFSFYYRSKTQYRHMMNKGLAFAVKWFIGDQRKARAWFIPINDVWYLFNCTDPYSNYNYEGALAKHLGVKIDGANVSLGTFIYVNSGSKVLYTGKNPGGYHNSTWSDYNFDDYDIEDETAETIMAWYADRQDPSTYEIKYICNVCKLPRLHRSDQRYTIEPHGDSVCKFCGQKMETFSMNRKRFDKAYFEEGRNEAGRRVARRIKGNGVDHTDDGNGWNY